MRTVALAAGKSAALAVLLAASTSACSGHLAGHETQGPTHEAFIEVTNNNWSDMVVYLRAGSARQRLGVAGSARTTRLRVADDLLPPNARVQLEGDPLAGNRGIVSEPVALIPGATLVWRIEATPALSVLSLR